MLRFQKSKQKNYFLKRKKTKIIKFVLIKETMRPIFVDRKLHGDKKEKNLQSPMSPCLFLKKYVFLEVKTTVIKPLIIRL